MKILITGAAGFIGSKLAYEMARRGHQIVGIDNLNTYYDPNLKYARLKEFYGLDIDPSWPRESCVPETGTQESVSFPVMPEKVEFVSHRFPNLKFIRMDIADTESLDALFSAENFTHVMNLAAQAGVRYSIKNPMAYIESNVVGFMNILECCRHHNIEHLAYASSSSVYGLNSKVPFEETDEVIRPVSIYAATKKSNELMAHAYGKLYGLPSTGLRYFTVYGPWGRPDMAPMLFATAISKGEKIKVFNNGDLIRDFTFIDDIVEGTIQTIAHTPKPNSDGISVAIYNIGCSNPVKLIDFICEIEKNMGTAAAKEYLPMQQGDVYQTNASTRKLEEEVGYHPTTLLPAGIKAFIDWYKQYNS